jgi:hypothetical protein
LGGRMDRSVHGHIVEEIKSILRSFDDYAIRTVRRSANEAAHLLAKYSCENKCVKTWLGMVPDSIVTRLSLDLC